MNITENREARVLLKKKREKSVKNRHPWIFSGAIDRVEGKPAAGDIVSLIADDGQFLAKGFFNAHSQIRFRALTFANEPIDDSFFRQRISQALALRQGLLNAQSNAYRAVHADGDLLPGLIVDRYDDALVVQFNTLGILRIKKEIVEILIELLAPAVIVERSDAQALFREGAETQKQILYGKMPERVEILENGRKFRVDLLEGQKTGFYLDQRDNRQQMMTIAAGKKLLNCFAYTGGFSVYAAKAGAQTTSVEMSRPALELAKENFQLNGFDPAAHEFVAANVFDYLRKMPDNHFDVIVLDPPAFVKQKQQVNKGARGYKDINRLAIQHVKPGGFLLTCSCSYFVNRDLFRKIVFSAAAEAGRNVQIIAQPAQPLDHPINIFHPEGEYLKSLLLHII